ncbi:transporter substrate-binding domain-containing protein [Pseudomonas sp. RIT-PI-AD]|uniref:substrate-binding periplasmic protein n=1 Tax=Pseudomonas sp. RIT-PI-AD TaxID=3035294 RepID=UPI0021D82292|nr:transporter substrate-binding domain-containing protein [Pseudomonas sp. RIT-PI-AD]
MRAWVLCLLTLWLLPLQAAERLPERVRLVSDEWPGYAERDGSGLAWEIMRLVFEPAGMRIDHRTEPYTRGVGLVQRGEADGWLGSYRGEGFEKVIYPQRTYGIDPVAALGLASAPAPDLSALKRYRLAWMRGYGYQRYLPDVGGYQEVQRRVGILEMLERGRADYYIDARPEILDMLAKSPEPQRYRITDLRGIPLYPGFADTGLGRALAALYDRRMEAILADGSLRALYARWNQPYLIDTYSEQTDASH